MSSIQKQPFIEKVLATLSEEQTSALKDLINGSDQTPEFKSLTNATYKITVSDKGVSHIVLETDLGKTSGYLVYTNAYCVFIGYQDIQELSMLKINVENQTYVIVKEPLTITELRFELGGSAGGGTPVEALEVDNIRALTNEEINGLNAGDMVIKKTGNQTHSYRVSYKENNTGICLTYTDASVSETVSYDYTGGNWVYNSTDITHLGDITANEIDSESATAGQVLTANGSGGSSWEDKIPTITIALSQVVSQSPLQIQLTQAQYDLFADNKQVIIDITALDPTLPIVVWEYTGEDSDVIIFGVSNGGEIGNYYYRITIDMTTLIATYNTGLKDIQPVQITSASTDKGKLLSISNFGDGILTNNLPILTTAPSQANTEGGIIIVVLSQEPQQKFSGYLYFIVNNS